MNKDDHSQLERQVKLFDDVEGVVADVVRFKIRLGIGEDAYTSMRIGKRLQALWDVGGVAASGAGFAASPAVASTFFSSGWLSIFGFGTAVTPVGWVIAAAAVSGVAYVGVTRLFTNFGDQRVTKIPKFINTPIDILGTKLFELIAPLAVKICRIDGDYNPDEREALKGYFIGSWGMDPAFVEAALTVVEENTSDTSLNEIVSILAQFKKENPDCNYEHMCTGIVAFLHELAEADDYLDEREVLAIEKVEQILTERGRLSFSDLASYLPKVPKFSRST